MPPNRSEARLPREIRQRTVPKDLRRPLSNLNCQPHEGESKGTPLSSRCIRSLVATSDLNPSACALTQHIISLCNRRGEMKFMDPTVQAIHQRPLYRIARLTQASFSLKVHLTSSGEPAPERHAPTRAARPSVFLQYYPASVRGSRTQNDDSVKPAVPPWTRSHTRMTRPRGTGRFAPVTWGRFEGIPSTRAAASRAKLSPSLA